MALSALRDNTASHFKMSKVDKASLILSSSSGFLFDATVVFVSWWGMWLGQPMNTTGYASKATFCDLYCGACRIGREAFCLHVWQCCAYPHARFLMPWLLRFQPRHFDRDFELLRFVAEVTSVQELAREINLHYDSQPETGILRGLFRLRLSGRRLLALGQQLWDGMLAAEVHADATEHAHPSGETTTPDRGG
jgi:hypothetical protein